VRCPPFWFGAVPTEAPTILVGQRNSTCCPTDWPIGYGACLQLIIRNITPFGQWPAPLGNGILGKATGRPVGERSELENAPLGQGYRGLPG
jgi:hypothetical protein